VVILEALCVFTTGVVPVTTTVSASNPTCSVIEKDDMRSANTLATTVAVEKPERAAVTSY